MSDNPVYLDSASTTFVDPEVQKAIQNFWAKNLGNAGSIHHLGVLAAQNLEMSRQKLARALGAQPEEIVFTSGGTESNNLAILGHFRKGHDRRKLFLCSAIEHSSVFSVRAPLAEIGVEFATIPVDSDGRILIHAFERMLEQAPGLVSIMQANNEIGSIQDIETLGRICHERGILLHVDACQSFTKLPLNVATLPVDLVSVCAHKIHGPRGIGALYIRKGVEVAPLFFGGGQEFGARPGTHNVEGAVGFAKAVELAEAASGDWTRVQQLRDMCASGCEDLGFKVTAKNAQRLPNILNVHKSGFKAKSAMFELSKENIFVSLASACHASKNAPSHVLTALDMNLDSIAGALRISLSRYTKQGDIEKFLSALKSLF